jgi:hypothetical protein
MISNNIPVQEAIDSGAWLRGKFPFPEGGASPWERGESVEFQIKITGLSKLNLNEIDCVEVLPSDLIKSDSLWVFAFEIVNLSKKEIGVFWIKRQLFLADNDGFEFKVDDNASSWVLNSEFSNKCGLRNFFSLDLPPKIKRSGAVLFELPEFMDVMLVKVRNGTLTEL